MRSLIAALLLVSVAANAQEGFPLDGTWRGQHPSATATPATVVIIMEWDGKQISGTINPGPGSVKFSGAKLVPEGWHLTIAAKSAKGEPIGFDGTLGELGSYKRTLTGKWTEGGKTYDVRFTRE